MKKIVLLSLPIIFILSILSFSLVLSTDYFLNEGESIPFNGKTVTLMNVTETFCVIDVDGTTKLINQGESKTFDNIEIQVVEIYYLPEGQSSAKLHISESTTPENKTCTDSDGGKNYYTKGAVTVCTFTELGGGCVGGVDYCVGDVLKEGYCEGSDSKLEAYTCPNGCEDGVCFEQNETTIPTTISTSTSTIVTTSTSTITTTAVCGNDVCEPNEVSQQPYGQITSCPEDCGYEIDPYDANVASCTSASGKYYLTTGPQSAPWFIWGGCAKYKYYQVTPGQQIRLHAYTDSCSGCVCYYPNFYIYEYQNGQWVHSQYFDLPDKKGQHYNEYYTPTSDKIKVYATGCFYLDIFSKSNVLTTTSTIPEITELSVDITSPKNGETVYGKVTVIAKASGDNNLGNMYLSFQRGGENIAKISEFTNCAEGVDCTSTNCIHSKECKYTWDTSEYSGEVILTALITDSEGNTATDTIKVNVKTINPLKIDFLKPADGEKVSDTTTVIVSASGPNKLTNMTLSIGTVYVTDLGGGGSGVLLNLKDCVDSAGCTSNLGCTYYKKCEYEWQTLTYYGTVYLTASIGDDKGNIATDTVKVQVVNYNTCHDKCVSEGYKYGTCREDCESNELYIGNFGCPQFCQTCKPDEYCPPCKTGSCCCSKKSTCPYECCVNDPDYIDKPCSAVACPTCVPDEECAPCIQSKCVNHECVWEERPGYEIKFKAGWNMFSLPVKKTYDQNVSDDTDCVFTSNLLHYSDGKYNVADYPYAGKGYWIKAESDCRMRVDGSSVSISDFPTLKRGWNQIGGPSKNVNIYSVAGDCDILSGPWTYNAAAERYQKAQVLKPGEGYFIKVNSDCNLGSDIPPPPPSESSGITGMAIRVW